MEKVYLIECPCGWWLQSPSKERLERLRVKHLRDCPYRKRRAPARLDNEFVEEELLEEETVG